MLKNILTSPYCRDVRLSNNSQVPDNFTDSRDGKVYKTVTIGTQTWMAENLAYEATTVTAKFLFTFEILT